MSALHIPTSDATMRRAPVLPAQLEFDAVYQAHFRFVWSTLLRLGVPRHAVEDASQETFLVVHRRLGDFEGHGSPRAWLFGIARRVAFRARRSQDRRQRKISALRTERRCATPLDDAVAQRQLSALLLDALDELDDDKRAALTLHVFEEMSGPKVAEALGLKVDTAYSRIKAGRRALKRVLEERGMDADVATLAAATREHTRPDAQAQGRVAALLAVPLSGLVAPAVVALSWKGIFIVATVGVVSVVGVQVFQAPADLPPAARAPATQIFVEQDPLAPVVSAQDRTRPSVTIPAPGPTASIRPMPVRPRPQPATTTTTPARDTMPVGDAVSIGLRAEVELIDRATTVLRSGDASSALAILREHAQRFPSGQLAGERRAYRAVALCSAGKTKQGRAEARLSRAANPSKALVAWLDAACGPTHPPASGG